MVDDPDLGKDLVTLGMIKNLEVEGKRVSFRVELTTPACPMKDQIRHACETAVKHLVSKDVELEIEMGAQVSQARQGGEVLPGVKNIIAVVSGKGGVGKSTVSVNLALGLAAKGAKVGLIDADIYGPSVPLMLGLKQARPQVKEVDGKSIIIPVESAGLKVLSIGFLVDEEQAVVWRGPMASSALRQFIQDCDWGELDYLVLDLPPGTGDIHLTMVQTVPVTGAVVVTTPQEVALADARKAMAMFKMPNIQVPVLGIVENMAWFSPEELPDNKYYIFGQGGGQRLADDLGVPLLGQLPLVEGIREGGDMGQPAVLHLEHPAKEHFLDLAGELARQVSIRNAQMPASQIVNMN